MKKPFISAQAVVGKPRDLPVVYIKGPYFVNRVMRRAARRNAR